MLTVKCSPALYRRALARHESHSGETASVHTLLNPRRSRNQSAKYRNVRKSPVPYFDAMGTGIRTGVEVNIQERGPGPTETELRSKYSGERTGPTALLRCLMCVNDLFLLFASTQKFIYQRHLETVFTPYYYMAESLSGQDDANPPF